MVAAHTLRNIHRREWLVLILVLTLVVLGGLAGMMVFRPAPSPGIGNITDFPAGSVTPVQLPVRFVDPGPIAVQVRSAVNPDKPVHIYLVNDPKQGLLAFLGRDSHSGCDIAWVEVESSFIDPCHGSRYHSDGTWFSGPASRNLDQFGLVIQTTGTVEIKTDDFRQGKAIR